MTSQDRLTARDGALLIVDVQGKLMTHIWRRDQVIANCSRLIRAAQALHMPHWATEQYPKGLGPTVDELAGLIPHRPDKQTFHCCSVGEVVEGLHGHKIRHVTLAGIEAHVCVAQTALELLNLGFLPQVVADGVSSRSEMDWEFALRRLEHAGAIVSTTEAVLFEWVEASNHPQFKLISNLVKEGDTRPAAPGTP